MQHVVTGTKSKRNQASWWKEGRWWAALAIPIHSLVHFLYRVWGPTTCQALHMAPVNSYCTASKVLSGRQTCKRLSTACREAAGLCTNRHGRQGVEWLVRRWMRQALPSGTLRPVARQAQILVLRRSLTEVNLCARKRCVWSVLWEWISSNTMEEKKVLDRRTLEWLRIK